MGNVEAKDLNKGNYIEKQINWSSMNPFEQVEFQMPFHTMNIEVYERRLKKYTFSREKVLMSQLRAAFKDDEVWIKALTSTSSTLYIMLTGFFSAGIDDETKQQAFKLQDLLLLGVLLCEGNQDQKGTCLYHLFQDNVQPTISAADADIVEIFEKVVKFSTVMIY